MGLLVCGGGGGVREGEGEGVGVGVELGVGVLRPTRERKDGAVRSAGWARED